MTIPELYHDVKTGINKTKDTVHTDDHERHTEYLKQQASQDITKTEGRDSYNEWRPPWPRPRSAEFEIIQRSSLLLPCLTKPPTSEAYGNPSNLSVAMS
jgi:hypothetical protein